LVHIPILHLHPIVYPDTVGSSFKEGSLMPFEFGTCPCCGTENSVFRGVKPLLLQTPDEQALDRRESAAYVVDWKCCRCGRQFQTQEVLQIAARSGV
jgi:hypothetical protein